MPLQETSGNLTTDAYGGGAAVVRTYIEDVFSTWLYTGNSSTQNIVNGIDLAGKGGLVWLKGRSLAVPNNLWDSARGITNGPLESDNTNQAYSNTPRTITSFNSDGFSMQDDSATFGENVSPRTQVSWTFRKQPKFFDIVTYTGTGANRTIAHALGSVPGSIIVKRTDASADWQVYHQSLANTEYLVLNTTAAKATGATRWNSTTPTSSVFSLGTDATVNASGGTYVAYIFAHNAGGFGLTGSDNVISCGSFTTDGSGSATVNLGYEPQWFLVKRSSGAENWFLYDTMRGFANLSDQVLFPNLSNAENDFGPTSTSYFTPTATGVNAVQWFGASSTYIYIAIRRGPMKVPTDATKVFSPKTWTGTGATANVTGIGFPSDLWIAHGRNLASQPIFDDRLRGAGQDLFPNQTTAETTQTSVTSFASMDGVTFGTDSGVNLSTYLYINYAMRRAPSFFDEVCYTGTGSNTTVSHNLGVQPELWITKARSAAGIWVVGSTQLANTDYLSLNTTNAVATLSTNWNSTYPTSSVVSLGTAGYVNTAGQTNAMYLFATCAGVSKVGSYTGNGTTQTINCGFGAGGARFVLIKRTDAVGGWYVYDTARGMTTLTDPYLFLNSNAAETATLGSVTTVSTGFALNAAILAAINTNAASYIFLAIA
jgi:hypothetical protein